MGDERVVYMKQTNQTIIAVLVGWSIGQLIGLFIFFWIVPAYQDWHDRRAQDSYEKALPSLLKTCDNLDRSKWANVCLIGPPGPSGQ